MQKLIMVLGSMLMMVGCANDPYKIDDGATANAPWKVGEAIYSQAPDNERSHSRKFIGITQDGYYLVQDFYAYDHNLQRTDPFIIMNRQGLKFAEPPLYHGRVVIYNDDGSIRTDCSYNHGTMVSPPCVTRNEDGDVRTEWSTSYHDGIRLNEFRYYENNVLRLTIQREYNYDKGVSDEVSTYYYPSGQKMSQIRMRDGQQVGETQYWDEDGEPSF